MIDYILISAEKVKKKSGDYRDVEKSIFEGCSNTLKGT
jgi:hypothetical protein